MSLDTVYRESLEVIREIIQKPPFQKDPLRVEITEDDGWIVLSAPTRMYKGCMLAGIYWISVLNNQRWYEVNKRMKIRCIGFAAGPDEQRSVDWMKRYFVAFEMQEQPNKMLHEKEFDDD